MKSDPQGKSNVSIDMASTKKKKNKVLNTKKFKAKDFVEKKLQLSQVNNTLISEKTNVKSLAQDSQLEINFPRGKRKFNTLIDKTSNSVYKKKQESVNIFDQSTMPKEKDKNSGEKNHRNKFNPRSEMSEEQKEERTKRKREKNKKRKKDNKLKVKEEYQQNPSGRVLVKARLSLNSMLINSEDNVKRAPVQDVDKIAADFKKMVSGKGMKASKLKNAEYEEKLSKKSAVLNKLSKKQRIVDTNELNNMNQKVKNKNIVDRKQKKKRTLFVGNLPLTMNKKMLRQLFKRRGFEVDTARIRNAVPEKESLSQKVANITQKYHSNVTSLNGYVCFISEEEAKKALAMNGKEVESHHIRVNFASDTEEKGDHSIFLGNLPFDIKDETLWTAFTSYGKIKTLRVIRDKNTGVGRGFGFISFQDMQSMNKLLKMAEIEVEGRKVRMKYYNNSVKKSGETNKPRWSTFKSGAINQKRREKGSSKKSIKKRVKRMKNNQQKKKISKLFDKN